MGIVHPRPAMRGAEARRIMAKFKRHMALMLQFEREGLTRERASAKAYEEIRRQDTAYARPFEAVKNALAPLKSAGVPRKQ